MESGNRFPELFLGLSGVFALKNRSHVFDHGLRPSSMSEVSKLSGLALSCPFEGGRMISQILISFWKVEYKL